jgi:hypothetical protein
MLGVPEHATRFQRALLAYDGSPHAKEALFVATYFAEMWKTELIVFTALDGSRVKADAQDYVRRYLDIHEVEAHYIISDRGATDYLTHTIEEHNVDLVLVVFLCSGRYLPAARWITCCVRRKFPFLFRIENPYCRGIRLALNLIYYSHFNSPRSSHDYLCTTLGPFQRLSVSGIQRIQNRCGKL